MLLYDTPPTPPPSSVSLMSQTPPMQMTGPSGPAPVDPIVAPPQPGWLDRMLGRVMPAPAGYGSLISDDDLRHARRSGLLNFGLSMLDAAHNAPGMGTPSLGQAFSKSVRTGLDSYNQDVNQNLQQRLGAQQIAQQQLILANRMRVAQQYAPTENETPDQTAQRLRQMYLEYLRVGDTDMAGKLGEVVSKLFADSDKPVEHVDLGDRTAILDPKTGRVLRYETNGPKPKSGDEVTATNRFNATQTNAILDDYRTDTKTYRTALDGYRVLQGALQSPNLTTPFAALDAYARVINPGAVVRQGTMAILQEMGSYDQKVRRWLSMAEQGQWPSDMLQDIKTRLDAVMRGHHVDYQDARRRAVLRGQMLGIPIEPLLDRDADTFGNDTSAPPAGKKGDAGKVLKAGSY